MTTTWEIETQAIPKFFDDHKAYFLDAMLYSGSHYICDLFNRAFKMHFDNKRINHLITYSPNEFYDDVEFYNENDRLLFIEIPSPRKSELSYNIYVKYYFIPYRINANKIEIFDMFGIDTVKDTDIGFIIWYKDAQHLMSNLRLPTSINNREEIVKFMYEYIFSRI